MSVQKDLRTIKIGVNTGVNKIENPEENERFGAKDLTNFR